MTNTTRVPSTTQAGSTTYIPHENTNEGGRNLLGRAGPALYIGVPIVGLLLLVIVVGIWLYKRHQDRKNQIRHQEESPTPVFEVVVSEWNREVYAMSAPQEDLSDYDCPKAPPSHADSEVHQYAEAQKSPAWRQDLYATGGEFSQNSSDWRQDLYATGGEASRNSSEWNQYLYTTGGNVAPKVPPRKPRTQNSSKSLSGYCLNGLNETRTEDPDDGQYIELSGSAKRKEKGERTVSNERDEESEPYTVGQHGLFATKKIQRNNQPVKGTKPPAGFSSV
jgi:hypothetical protein